VFQQVNLYEPIFREEPKLFSAATICAALGIVAAGLLTIATFSAWRLAGLERELAAVRAQEATQQKLIARTDAFIDQGESEPRMEARLQAMAQSLERRQLALRYLRGTDGANGVGAASGADAAGAADAITGGATANGGDTAKRTASAAHHGFAERLAALARQQLDGLWLTGVIFTANAGDLVLSGGATSAALVPAYLGRLANEPALAGTRLQSIEIREPQKPVRGEIEFRVSSAALGAANDGTGAPAVALNP
jgi:hypothetical protein